MGSAKSCSQHWKLLAQASGWRPKRLPASTTRAGCVPPKRPCVSMPRDLNVLAALRYLQNLSGDHTLGLARSWSNEPDGRGVAARRVFERHAESSDQPLLISGLTEAWEARDFYALCSFIDALARLSDPEPIGQIAAIFEQAEYSYARCRAARALIAIGKEVFIERYARSALWDCEREIQDLATSLLVGPVDEAAARQIGEVESRRIK